MKTVLIRALVLEEQEGTVRVMLDDGFGQFIHRVTSEKALLDQTEKKPDHVRIRSKK